MKSKIAKEVFIIALLLMVIVFAICVLFYDCLPGKNEKIETIEYSASEEVQKTLDEIKSNDAAQNGKSDSLLKSYSIDANDLNSYASENSYESGKKNPFAEYAEPVQSEIVSTTTNASSVSTQEPNVIETEENKEETKEIKIDTKENNTVVENKVEEKKEETVKNTVETKVQKESTTGTYFEKKNSK